MFQIAKQNRVFQDVIFQIEDAILQGRLKIGERLPAERALKEMFGTSRGTIREALRVLEQKGLISIKTGTNGGAYVENVSIEKISESLDLLIRSQSLTLEQIAQFREDVEGNVTFNAALAADNKGIETLKKTVEKVKNASEEGIVSWGKFIEADNEFHMQLAKIVGNPIYISILRTVHENINRYYDRFLEKEEIRMKENYEDMRGIIAAIENKDAEGARLIARSHVKRFNQFMENKLNQSE